MVADLNHENVGTISTPASDLLPHNTRERPWVVPRDVTKYQPLLATKDDMNDPSAADAVISHETELEVIRTDAYLLELLTDQPIKVQIFRDFMHRVWFELAG